jgi:Leucine-rich repeat (LRR) protein
LDLSGNNLQGVVNGELLKGHTNLAVLRLSDNQLTNVTLPTDLKSLRVLDIARNRIVDIGGLKMEGSSRAP